MKIVEAPPPPAIASILAAPPLKPKTLTATAMPQVKPAEAPQESAATVLLSVIVTDSRERFVVGLEKEHFRVFENGIEQEISQFSKDASPVSVAIIANLGIGSPWREVAQQATRSFLSQARAGDEFCLIQFNAPPQLAAGWTENVVEIEERLNASAAPTPPALPDSIEMAIRQLQSARSPRKAILIVSDGSWQSGSEAEQRVKAILENSNIPIFAVSAVQSSATPLLTQVAEQSGGRHFTIDRSEALQQLPARVRIELGTVYLVGFQPKNAVNDGSFRQISIQLSPPLGISRLNVRVKTGYVASKR
jgi:VWFA-related protein